MFNELKEECGVFGMFSRKAETAKLAMYGLFAIQHRGQESAGISSSDGYGIYSHKGLGLVSEVFKNEDELKKLRGHIAIAISPLLCLIAIG